MAGKITKNYKVAGNGTLNIDGDTITISVEDKGDFNLAQLLSELDGCEVKFNFSYNEDYEEPEYTVDEETGEVI